MIFSSGREFDLYKVQNLGLCKILNTIFVLLFAMLDVLVRDSCFAVFSHASTCSPPLPCNTRREGSAKVQALPSSRPRTTQISRSLKDPRTSLGGSERWLGPLCVYCKLVVESRSGRAKKNSENSDNLMNINQNMAKLG